MSTTYHILLAVVATVVGVYGTYNTMQRGATQAGTLVNELWLMVAIVLWRFV